MMLSSPMTTGGPKFFDFVNKLNKSIFTGMAVRTEMLDRLGPAHGSVSRWPRETAQKVDDRDDTSGETVTKAIPAHNPSLPLA
mmetsp:Transcript_15203/g.32631  ORF Transcript_15203/g.32631 Transcript_15203/m.32631 type:complete len:83 (+) Transcript_15203:244-492(+)